MHLCGAPAETTIRPDDYTENRNADHKNGSFNGWTHGLCSERPKLNNPAHEGSGWQPQREAGFAAAHLRLSAVSVTLESRVLRKRISPRMT
jgi:hypothetical protein